MVNMTKAGEAGGFLDAAMRQIADNFEAEVRAARQDQGRAHLPGRGLHPRDADVLRDADLRRPRLQASMFERPGRPAAAADADPGHALGRDEVPRAARDRLAWPSPSGGASTAAPSASATSSTQPKLKLPVFGNLFQKLALTRFARNLGTLLSSGVPILQSLDIVSETTGSIVISRALKQVQESVRRGESVAGPLAEHEVFPPMVVQMIASGEEAGAIDQMLNKIAEFYDEEVEAMTESLTALIEPLMIAFLGGVVGSMIVALYMPIFKIFDMIK